MQTYFFSGKFNRINTIYDKTIPIFKVNAARKSKVDDNTARMQSIKQLGV